MMIPTGTATIFVDCFNTVLQRTASPEDVLFSWSKALGEQYGHHAAFFYHAFAAAQRRLATRALFRTGEAEYSFREVSDLIAEQLPGVDGDAFHRAALALYVETEQRFQTANTALCEELAARKQAGCKLYLLSDFYCGKEVLREFLGHAGVDLFDDIFVSCDLHRSKRTGALYRYALKATGADRKHTCMIGDGRIADRLMARLNFLRAFDPQTRSPKMSAALKAELKKGEWERQYEEIFATYGKQYNYSNYAFPLYLFTKRLYESFTASGATHLFFCSREGQFLKKLFDAYCAYHGHPISTHYFYVSRNSVSALRPLEEENFEYVQVISPKASVSTFLKSNSFSAEQIQAVLAHLGIQDDRRKANFYRSETYRRLLADSVFQTCYRENQQRNVVAFTKYMESFGVDLAQNGLYLVDVGWRGGVQYYLERFYGEKVKVHGYYLGLSHPSPTKEGILWTKAKEKRTGNKLFRHRILDYEQVLRADHDRVAGYAVEGDGATVVFGKEIDHGKLFREFIGPLQEQIYEKFLRIMEVDREHAGFSYTACKYFRKMMTHISKEDAAWLQRCEDTHYDYFGHVGIVFQDFGHTLVHLFHGAQNLKFRFISALCAPVWTRKKML